MTDTHEADSASPPPPSNRELLERIAVNDAIEKGREYADPIAVDAETALWLAAVIRRVPDDHLFAYKKHYRENVPQEEIAKDLNVSPSTVKEYLVNALAMITRRKVKLESKGVVSPNII
jgi:DNA-directed RNA polymerase specialized sigma24 family protein